MNIVVESRAFYPSIGGLEMMGRELARRWQSCGHNVRVATVIELDGYSELPELEVVRLPSTTEWLRLMRWGDIFFQNGVSLRSLPYALLTGLPVVYRHPNLLTTQAGEIDWRNYLKRLATTFGYNVASCKAVANTVSGPTKIIPNTFRPVFDQPDAREESREGLLFVGRLVSVKGADVAIEVLRRLRARGVDTTLTVCGDGPNRTVLEQQARDEGLWNAVSFEGWTSPEELAEHYRKAEALLVPSRYEPFGIVALEAIASRCPVVASNVDGLPEAVGDCGILVEPDAPEALADGIQRVLDPSVREQLRAAMPEHVDRHRMDRIADEYLDIIRTVAHEA